MSHDRGWRAACDITLWILQLPFAIHEVARGVTAMVVGSGALLGLWFISVLEPRRKAVVAPAIPSSPAHRHKKLRPRENALDGR